jgi:CRISPR-associated protein Cas1
MGKWATPIDRGSAMKQILNTLFVMTQGASVSLDHETLKVEVDGKSVLQVPLHHLGGVVNFGNVMMSPFLMGRCISAAEGVGLDPQMGFMHALRLGKPSLALDLMEELRPVMADRLALTLVNRQQLADDDFDIPSSRNKCRMA